jgi:superfamily II DNA/RNA helicase
VATFEDRLALGAAAYELMLTFASLGLHPALLAALNDLGYHTPTPVQAEAIPGALPGGDWMVASQTGSGKTAAFLLPVVSRLASGEAVVSQRMPEPAGGRRSRNQSRHVAAPQLLVLCPTRELAQQVANEAIKLVRHLRNMRVATILGGMPFRKQIADLAHARIVVATPGRLLDLHQQGVIALTNVNALVVDEADRMLDLGFQEDLDRIQQLAGGREQTLMFSATFAPRIMALAEKMMREPKRIELSSATERHENITHSLYYADNFAHKLKLLGHWLTTPDLDQAIVFARTQVESEELAERLTGDGHHATALHGAMPQAVRNRRLQGLRQGHVRVLVATDVAARGIDVPTISHVINFGLPMKPEDYVHRIGRTGRAGRQGTAVTFAEASERGKVRAIERFIDDRIPEATIEGLEPTRRAPARSAPGARSGPRPAGRAPSARRADAPRPERRSPPPAFAARAERTEREDRNVARELVAAAPRTRYTEAREAQARPSEAIRVPAKDGARETAAKFTKGRDRFTRDAATRIEGQGYAGKAKSFAHAKGAAASRHGDASSDTRTHNRADTRTDTRTNTNTRSDSRGATGAKSNGSHTTGRFDPRKKPARSGFERRG